MGILFATVGRNFYATTHKIKVHINLYRHGFGLPASRKMINLSLIKIM
jgi:hypothetical protein